MNYWVNTYIILEPFNVITVMDKIQQLNTWLWSCSSCKAGKPKVAGSNPLWPFDAVYCFLRQVTFIYMPQSTHLQLGTGLSKLTCYGLVPHAMEVNYSHPLSSTKTEGKHWSYAPKVSQKDFFFIIEQKWELILNFISSTKSTNSDKTVVLESTSWFLRLFAVSVLISNGIYIIYTYYILTMLAQLFQTFLYLYCYMYKLIA